MEARIITGKVASSVVQCRRLFLSASLDFDSRPQGVPIGVRAAQVEADPGFTALAAVFQQHRFPIHR